MRVGQDLLDCLQRTEVHDPRCFEELIERRTIAVGHGSLRYELLEPHRVHDASPGPLTAFGNTVLGGLQLSHVLDRLGTRITFPESHPLGLCILTVLDGALHIRADGHDLQSARAGDALLLQPVPGREVTTTDGSERLNLWLNAQALTKTLERSLGHEIDQPIRFAPASAWPQGTARSIGRLVNFVAAEMVDPYSLFAGGVGLAAFEELAAQTLLNGVPHNYTELLARDGGPAPHRCVRRATAFMRANLGVALTVEDIARAAGCSARALAAAFRLHMGRTVSAVLTDYRLDAARDALGAGDPALRVGTIAARLGFSNPGRFAAAYRARFGEMPLRTRQASNL